MKTHLVIPLYNDVTRLQGFLPSLKETLPAHFDVLICDDGSLPQEKENLQKLVEKNKKSWEDSGKSLNYTLREKNLGKGASIQEGWEKHQNADILAFTDADGAVCAQEILRADTFFRQFPSYQALFGSRIQMLGREITRSLKRHISSRIFATLVNYAGNLPAYDTQCGLKLLRRSAYDKIAPQLQTQRFAFDVELALLLQHYSLTTIEFPVDWTDIPGSKVSLFRDSIQMAQETFKIKKRIDQLPL